MGPNLKSIEINGNQWEPFGIYGNQRKATENNWDQKKSMESIEINGHISESMEISGNRKNPRNPRKSMENN